MCVWFKAVSVASGDRRQQAFEFSEEEEAEAKRRRERGQM
jgi:hypothetical protein